MKYIVYILMSIFPMNQHDYTMSDVRRDYHTTETEGQVTAFLEKYGHDCVPCRPYVASVMMQRAQFATWPFRKLSLFNEGRNYLEDYIKEYPNDLEARYVRLLVQWNAPGILGYHSDIEADRAFIDANLKDWPITDAEKKSIQLEIRALE